MNLLTQKATAVASPLLILFAFTLPLSTSVSSVLAILMIILWLASGAQAKKLQVIFHNPVAIGVLVYLLLHLLGLLWSDDLDWGIHILLKQWKLLLFPVFLTLAKKEHSPYYQSAFIAAITLKACKAYLVWLGVIELPGSAFTTEGTSHVVYNPMLALAIYIILQDFLFQQRHNLMKALQGLLFFFLSCNMFVTAGRTGQVVFFVLLAVALCQYFYRRSRIILVGGLLLLPLLVVAIYQFSPTFHSRVDTAVTELKNYRSGEITSMGCRLWFCSNTWLLLQDHWLTGVGTGDFPAEYAEINQARSPAMPDTDNPHNQYFLTTSLFGITGLLVLLAIFGAQLVYSFKKKDSLTPLRQAFPLFFLIIMLSESYLQVYETGFLFSLFSAFLYNDFADTGQPQSP